MFKKFGKIILLVACSPLIVVAYLLLTFFILSADWRADLLRRRRRKNLFKVYGK